MTHQATLILGGQTLQLLPERCAFWQEAGVLLLADLHLGKAAHLRHHGMAIPEGHTADDLTRLSRVLHRTQAREVIICGDFFHASTDHQRPSAPSGGPFRQPWTGLARALLLVAGPPILPGPARIWQLHGGGRYSTGSNRHPACDQRGLCGGGARRPLPADPATTPVF